MLINKISIFHPSFDDFRAGFDDYEKGILTSTAGPLSPGIARRSSLSAAAAESAATPSAALDTSTFSFTPSTKEIVHEGSGEEASRDARSLVQQLVDNIARLEQENRLLAQSLLK